MTERPRRPMPPPTRSRSLYARVAPADVAMFRFLLEARDNLAYFTVVNRFECLMRVVFAPGAEREARRALDEIGTELPLTVIDPAKDPETTT